MPDDWQHDGPLSIRIVREPIGRAELRMIAARQFGDFVKAVVDCRMGLLAVGGELHSDEESVLLSAGSHQPDLWGINLYPDIPSDDWIEYDSMINLRPGQGNTSRGVDDVATQQAIIAVVRSLVRDAT